MAAEPMKPLGRASQRPHFDAVPFVSSGKARDQYAPSLNKSYAVV
jgi:hypothetical protein